MEAIKEGVDLQIGDLDGIQIVVRREVVTIERITVVTMVTVILNKVAVITEEGGIIPMERAGIPVEAPEGAAVEVLEIPGEVAVEVVVIPAERERETGEITLIEMMMIRGEGEEGGVWTLIWPCMRNLLEIQLPGVEGEVGGGVTNLHDLFNKVNPSEQVRWISRN